MAFWHFPLICLFLSLLSATMFFSLTCQRTFSLGILRNHALWTGDGQPSPHIQYGDMAWYGEGITFRAEFGRFAQELYLQQRIAVITCCAGT